MYEIYEKLLELRGTTSYKVSQATGVSQSVLSAWKNGISTPKAEKRRKIAEYLGVSLEYLDTGIDNEKESTSGQKYYFDDETAKKAQELFENKDMRMLFEAAQGASPEDLQMAATLLAKLKKTNPELSENDGF